MDWLQIYAIVLITACVTNMVHLNESLATGLFFLIIFFTPLFLRVWEVI